MKELLMNYINAGYGALAIETNEYQRNMKEIVSMTRDLTGFVYMWDARGDVLNMLTGAKTETEVFDLDAILEHITKTITQQDEASEFPVQWVIHDSHLFMNEVSALTVALFRDARELCSMNNHHIILVGAELIIPKEVEKIITKIDYNLPNKAEIENILRKVVDNIDEIDVVDADIPRIISASAGMTSTEIEDAIILSIVSKKGEIDWRLIMKEKAKAVEKSGALKYHSTEFTRADVGGNESLMDYIALRKNSFSDEAIAFGCPAPKGIIMVGSAGTGKSLGAKVAADILNRPLISIDIGAVFGSLVGESEAGMRNAIKTIEAVAPCVLMIDEIEKGLSGSKSSGQSDGGTGSRVMGTLLSWMNDKTSEVYIVATCNDVTSLPPELLRKGRFDELFFVDIPNSSERESIIKIHLTKRDRKPSDFDLEAIVCATDNYTGAEIEQVIIDGLYVAFGSQKELSTKIILQVISETSPSSVINKTKIDSLRDWAKDRCRKASKPVPKTTKQIKRSIAKI